MKCAHVDTSCLVAVAFDEAVATETARVLAGYDRLVASSLLESELRSVLTRERSEQDPSPLLQGMSLRDHGGDRIGREGRQLGRLLQEGANVAHQRLPVQGAEPFGHSLAPFPGVAAAG